MLLPSGNQFLEEVHSIFHGVGRSPPFSRELIVPPHFPGAGGGSSLPPSQPPLFLTKA